MIRATGMPVRAVAILFFLSGSVFCLYGADSPIEVQLDSKLAGPRVLESLTERRILGDYRFAWASLAHALEFNSVDPLEGPFAGDAKQCLKDTVISQRRSGIRQRYANQTHRLQAVFYAPEGDVMELHDTAEYQLQILDGDRIIHNDHIVTHYIVLMTPSADRWVVRQLQAVPQFDGPQRPGE